MFRLLLLIVASLLIAGCSQAQEKTASGILLKNVLLAGDTTRTSVLVEGSSISEIGDGPFTAETVVDCSELVAVPGFIDSHVHLGFFQPKEVLAGGLTVVRDLGWKPETAFAWVKDSSEPAWGPKVLAAGPMITTDKGYPVNAGWAPKGTGVVYSDGLVEQLADAGSSVIKVALEPRSGPTLSAEELGKLVEQARGRGLKVVAHVSTVSELEKALSAGVQEYCHFLFDQEAVPDDLISRMVEAKAVVMPTLRCNPHPQRLENLSRFYQAGGTVLYGTDLGNGGRPGIDVEELKLLEKAGMTPQDILASATSVPAKYLGLRERGKLEVSAVADIILVKEDPLKNWDTLLSPQVIFREGDIVLKR